jgi:hypothetical protein
MKTRKLILMISLAILLLAVAGGVLAQVDLPLAFDISWFTIDGGGGASSGGAYSLNGTIGQADAGNMSGGAYTLQGGFWAGAGGPVMLNIYLPMVRR